MAITDNLGAPLLAKILTGKQVLYRYHRDLAAAAAPIVSTNITGLQNVTPGPITYQDEFEKFQLGGGTDSTKYRAIPRHDLSMTFLPGYAPDFIAGILGQTWSSDFGIIQTFRDYPLIQLEAIVRTSNNTTQSYSVVYQDLIPLEPAIPTPLEEIEVELPFYSKHVPFILNTGYHMVLDSWTGDGSTTDFTTSATAVDLFDTALAIRNNDDFNHDKLVFVKLKTSSETIGTRQTSGYSLAATTLTITVAPAASTRIWAFYAAAN